ncbi:hypothetical protein MPSI1_003697 [Malassezia psittaci]|uniref:Methyltransferase type 11 domain-containing protein n=1 Tax=Malassezia psittaci TaxID=1821823 RepID=A0AAF0F867_9BASI|nr:hypothetical protein MPSI1_003697 [Malassezia psittaci]
MHSSSRYTHGYNENVLTNHRGRTAENSANQLLPYLNSEQQLLDIGSGAGTITCGLAKYVNRVTALEVNEQAIDLTRKEADRQSVSLDYVVGDIHSLPFDDNTFDVVHAHQVLQHIDNQATAMKEMRRVTKPGGIVACRESIYSAFTWYPPNHGLDKWKALYMDVVRSNGGEPDAGARLLEWAQQAGFTDNQCGVYTWCFATPQERDHWGGMWEKRIVMSDIADSARSRGVSEEELRSISAAWAEWKDTPCGWYMVPHAHIIAQK